MTATFNPSAISTIVMGDESLTIACGDVLLAGGHSIAAVITRDATVSDWAEAHGLTKVSTAAEAMALDLSADWLLSIANLRMIPQALLDLPSKGAVNFHDGPLPRYAGLNTPAWAIINGEATHGVSWHMIEGGVDEGDILAQRMIELAADETAFSLNSKCYAAGMESFAVVLGQLEAGVLDRSPQDLSVRSYFAKAKRPVKGGMLDLEQDAAYLSALVRGLDFGEYWNPLGTAKLAVRDTLLSVRALEIDDSQSAAPGFVISVQSDAITVGTTTSAIRLAGLTTLAGDPVDASALTAVGATLTLPEVPELDVQGEDNWRADLCFADHCRLPLVVLGEGDGLAELPLNIPADLSIAQQVAAASAVVARSAGVNQAVLSFVKPTDNPLLAGWLPFTVDVDAGSDLATLVDLCGSTLERAQAANGMAADLKQRDPHIKAQAPSDVALSLDGTVSTTAALTIILDASAAKISYDTSCLSHDAATLMAARLEAGFANIANAGTTSDVWAMPLHESNLLAQWNDTARDTAGLTIHAAFEAQVARTPDAAALVFEAETLSYANLNARANQLAHVLREMGAGPGKPIGLYAARGVDLLVGVLGILKSGSAYVPLDPAYPADRIAHYITDSAAPIIVTQSGLAGQLPEHAAQVIEIDADARVGAALTDNPTDAAGANDLAYLIYTSGSTGTPKGVMVSHGNVDNFFAGMDERIDHAAGAVWLAVTSLSFDISVLELFWTLSRGFKLVLAGDESRTMVANGPVTASDRHIDFNLFYWGNDDGVGPKKYELLLEGARFADAHGFNAVWTPERHFHAFGGPYPNPSVTGAAVAAITQNLDVRAGSCVAPLHHPARIAEEWAVIDNLTNGRVGLAIASGWQPDDFVLRPENTPPQNKPAMYVAIDQLRALWRGEPVAFPTKDGTPFEVVTQPRPVSTKLPIWVTTAGNPQTWKEAGEIGANVLTHLLGQSVEEVAAKIKIYHAALREAGHDPADFKVTLMLHTYLAESREEAEATARAPMKDYLRSAAGLIKQYAWAFPAFKKPEGATTPFDVDLDGLSEEELDAILEFAFQRYFNDSGMFGTVADGVARTQELKNIGVDEIACLIDYGIATDKVMAGLKPLAKVLAASNQNIALADDDFSLAAQIVRHKVTHLQCTPSMAQMLVTNEDACATLGGLKHVMIGGEALPEALVRALRGATRATLQNMYGPTETTIWSTTHKLDDRIASTAPVGSPIANTDIFILNDNKDPQPVGVSGEMWIGGHGVTQGYWHRDALTAERFIDNPFGSGKLYGTGDLASWDENGVLHFGGRVDAQVKIRGHRIELGEIEARMAELPGVTQAVVRTKEMNGSTVLVGYVTGPEALPLAETQARLRDVLPEIMVPSHFVILDKMPLTPNRKIDRKALPDPQLRRDAAATVAAEPVSDTHAAIARVWSGLLGVNDIRGDDNFFALGGHSLLAIQAHRDIKAALGSALSITDIFRFPTLDGLAEHLGKGQGGTAPIAATPPPAQTADKAQTMSKRRAMRAGRSKAGA